MEMGEINLSKITSMPKDNTNVVVPGPHTKKSSDNNIKKAATVEDSSSVSVGEIIGETILGVLSIPFVFLPIACNPPEEKITEAEAINMGELDGEATSDSDNVSVPSNSNADTDGVKFTDESIKNDKEIVSAAVKNDGKPQKTEPTIDPLNDPKINDILTKSWEHYKKVMIAADGKPFCDADNQDIDGDEDTSEKQTFSEGVSYVLLRAAWMNDQTAFDKTWTWAKNHMQRKNLKQTYNWNKKQWTTPRKSDNLFSWRYIPTLKGKDGGVIDYEYIQNDTWRGCFEVASDADLDIAASLIFAYKKWNKQEYLTEAKAMLNDIWKLLVKNVNGKNYLFGGDQFVNMGEINPSYERPYYFSKLFPSVDSSHPWSDLTSTSYRIIRDSGDIDLQDQNGNNIRGKANLPPNWVDIKNDGSLTDSDIFKGQGGHRFGWDAFRTIFWVAQDYAWRPNTDAKSYLSDNTSSTKDAGPYSFFKKQLDTRGKISGGYKHDGTLENEQSLNQEHFCMDGAYLAYFYYAGDKTSADKIINSLKILYNESGYWGGNPNDYYGQNWAWFGLALINKGSIIDEKK